MENPIKPGWFSRIILFTAIIAVLDILFMGTMFIMKAPKSIHYTQWFLIITGPTWVFLSLWLTRWFITGKASLKG
jgi:hypothetical protein